MDKYNFCAGFAAAAVLFGLFTAFHLEAVWSAEPEPVEETHTECVECATESAQAVATGFEEEVVVPHYISIGTFETTGYCACEECCGEWADGYTATGTVATAGRTIAVDPDVIPYGTKLMVLFDDGSIWHYIAEDCGGTIKGCKLDIFYDNHEDAIKHGIQNASVYIEE